MNRQRKRRFSMSFDAMDRICEEAEKNDPSLAALNPNRPSLRAGRAMSDESLLARLRGLGIRVDRETLALGAKRHPSAEALSRTLVREAGVRLPDIQEADWAWAAMAVLWERWCPEEPGFELLNEHIAQGYKSQENTSPAAAADVWLRAWEDVLALARKLDTRGMTAFDEAFGGYQCVFNWCQDLGHALDDAGRGDAVYLRKAIAYGESLLATFSDLDPLIAGNTRRSIAEAHFKLGETERGNALFRAWLTDDALWGWGWIGWSDCHAWPYFGINDRREAERILREGLAIPGVRDRKEILDRLQDLCADGGDAIPAELPRSTPAPAMAEPARHAVGRNEPCPCGSWKKYKKCCLGV